ncbi:putative phosphoribosylaminoimidazole carboxylase [Lupinus albus]|uniref:phosphoribosylaminoimidazole carboxylase n=1 Tax=Lupinus albus TaxID=3870 RepID=A0A6A4QE00_LUPAL|nr:putative phosphoribosylaminoimidazole carboxylase [Lupinus albus]
MRLPVISCNLFDYFLKHEVAVIVVRGRDNSISCYPVVETIHREHATEVASNAVNSLEGVGVFAVELFLTENGQFILLNEVAPRPHNSGHHTIESCYTSQYENHLQAVVGLPLGNPLLKTPAAVMYNILGEEEGELGFQLAHKLIKRALTIPRPLFIEMRKQQKMGHITIVGPSLGNIESNLAIIVDGKTLDDKTAVAPRVGIIMGSDSDLPVMKSAAEILEMFGVPYEVKLFQFLCLGHALYSFLSLPIQTCNKFQVRIVSAHRTPELMFSYAKSADKLGIQVIERKSVTLKILREKA